jgi:PadR family transcriptional regulator, regulatory protein AphA
MDENLGKARDNPWQAHVTDRSLTGFEQVLLGLIVDEPSSGYALKTFLATTPASVYQPSSGALYPALKRLEQYGLLRSGLTVAAGRRKRRVYHATAAGIAAHVAWVRQPVHPETVAQDLGLHLMRFVFIGGLLPKNEVLVFLDSLAGALDALVGDLEQFSAAVTAGTAAGAGDAAYSVLALEHGIAVHRASLAWARRTRRALTRRGGNEEGPAGGGPAA